MRLPLYALEIRSSAALATGQAVVELADGSIRPVATTGWLPDHVRLLAGARLLFVSPADYDRLKALGAVSLAMGPAAPTDVPPVIPCAHCRRPLRAGEPQTVLRDATEPGRVIALCDPCAANEAARKREGADGLC